MNEKGKQELCKCRDKNSKCWPGSKCCLTYSDPYYAYIPDCKKGPAETGVEGRYCKTGEHTGQLPDARIIKVLFEEKVNFD